MDGTRDLPDRVGKVITHTSLGSTGASATSISGACLSVKCYSSGNYYVLFKLICLYASDLLCVVCE